MRLSEALTQKQSIQQRLEETLTDTRDENDVSKRQVEQFQLNHMAYLAYQRNEAFKNLHTDYEKTNNSYGE